MPKKKKDKEPMLRIRVNPGFLKEMDAYLAQINEGRVEQNKMGRSHLAREAVHAWIKGDLSKVTA
jgi:hypothetical protein